MNWKKKDLNFGTSECMCRTPKSTPPCLPASYPYVVCRRHGPMNVDCLEFGFSSFSFRLTHRTFRTLYYSTETDDKRKLRKHASSSHIVQHTPTSSIYQMVRNEFKGRKKNIFTSFKVDNYTGTVRRLEWFTKCVATKNAAFHTIWNSNTRHRIKVNLEKSGY